MPAVQAAVCLPADLSRTGWNPACEPLSWRCCCCCCWCRACWLCCCCCWGVLVQHSAALPQTYCSGSLHLLSRSAAAAMHDAGRQHQPWPCCAPQLPHDSSSAELDPLADCWLTAAWLLLLPAGFSL